MYIEEIQQGYKKQTVDSDDAVTTSDAIDEDAVPPSSSASSFTSSSSLSSKKVVHSILDANNCALRNLAKGTCGCLAKIYDTGDTHE